MLLTALLSSSSFISIKRQFSSSDGSGLVLFAVVHECSWVKGEKLLNCNKYSNSEGILIPISEKLNSLFHFLCLDMIDHKK